MRFSLTKRISYAKEWAGLKQGESQVYNPHPSQPLDIHPPPKPKQESLSKKMGYRTVGIYRVRSASQVR